MKVKITFVLVIFILNVFLFAEIKSDHEAMLMATLWQQTSAEYRALTFQAYNIAKLRLDEDLKIQSDKKRAIVIDLDETVLDNSSFQAKSIIEGVTYYNDFDEWIELAVAKPVPGALEFLNYANDMGVNVFYISNRDSRHMKGTLKNLQKLGFPQVMESHILLRDETSSKEPRRQKVAEDHFIVLYIGDNLIDFEDIFRKKSIEERFTAVEKFKDEFGDRFIILPNPMYGEWEKTLYGGTRKIPQEEKKKKLYENLKSY
ncbi:MAG: 5'-nucleotidase, lipoprotein e(P4) family [Candidatus Cloacimonetes bacterium]|nr:5'-nucleotidase, lipoprotein e(P4) family [Candidatus Cloacimonadota bacterium]